MASKYPCVRDLKELPDNREAVLRNFLSLERRLNRDPSLFQIYQAQIDDMKERKVCRQLPRKNQKVLRIDWYLTLALNSKDTF